MIYSSTKDSLRRSCRYAPDALGDEEAIGSCSGGVFAEKERGLNDADAREVRLGRNWRYVQRLKCRKVSLMVTFEKSAL